MATVVSEIGTMAAENVESILKSLDGAPAAPSDRGWRLLAEGGWATIASDPENEVELRDILEIARASGRYRQTTPLVASLLAGRWFGFDEDRLANGVSLALPHDGTSVAPYYSEGVRLLTAEGELITSAPSSVGDFALSCPVAHLAADVAPIEGGHLNEARAAYLAVAVGCADSAIRTAVDWAQTREQFGQAIKGFQAVRHHLANAHIAREQAWTASIAAAHEPDDSARWAHQGFALARTAIELSIQVHGGVGFTWEVGLHHYLNQVVELDSILGVSR